jgi:hypothetical protein
VAAGGQLSASRDGERDGPESELFVHEKLRVRRAEQGQQVFLL